MNIHDIPDYILRAEPMTAGELRKKIKNIPSDAKVYIVIDKVTEECWDDDNQRYRYAVPLAKVSKEVNPLEDAFGMETNILLEYEDP